MICVFSTQLQILIFCLGILNPLALFFLYIVAAQALWHEPFSPKPLCHQSLSTIGNVDVTCEEASLASPTICSDRYE